MEFVKVQDVNNITSEDASIILSVDVELESNSISYLGGTIKGVVKQSDYGSWTLEDAEYLYVNPTRSDSPSEITIDVPANITQEDIIYYISVTAGDVGGSAQITQSAGFGIIGTVAITLVNQSSETLRIGMDLKSGDYGITYRTVQPNQSITYNVVVPYNSMYWNFDFVLHDGGGGEAEAKNYELVLSNSDVIEGYDLDEFNENATHLSFANLNNSVLTVTEQ